METFQDLAQQIAGIKQFVDQKLASHTEPLREETLRLKVQVNQVLESQRSIRRQDLLSRTTGRKIQGGKYAGMDRLDLAFHQAILQAIHNKPSREDISPTRSKMLESWTARLKAAMDATTADAGDELVPTAEASVLWDDVNLETLLLPLFNRITMPSNPFDIPLQMGDVNWYPGTQNVALTSTALDTGKQTMTAYELGCMVPWSYDLDEDAVVAMADEVRRHLTRNAAEVIDDVLLNGDTTLTNNINADGATIAKTTAAKGHWLIGFDGLIHLPLIDNTAQRVDHNAAVTDDLFNKQRSKMDRFGVRPSEQAFVMDLNTFIRAQSVANYRTLDKLGPMATLLNGQLGAIEGIPVIVSEQMKLADTDGLVTSAGNVTDTGRVLLLNKTQWRVGFRREITIEVDRDVQKRQNIMVVSFRLAFMERSGARTTANHTSLTYDITGVS